VKIAVAQWSAFVLLRVSQGRNDRREYMLRKIITIAVITGAVAVSACNTVRGAAADVNSAANSVDNAT
jgi:predicted small secreted protein